VSCNEVCVSIVVTCVIFGFNTPFPINIPLFLDSGGLFLHLILITMKRRKTSLSYPLMGNYFIRKFFLFLANTVASKADVCDLPTFQEGILRYPFIQKETRFIVFHPVIINVDNVINSFLRFHAGNEGGHIPNGLYSMGCRNVITYRFSISWSVDNCCSV